MDGDPPPQASVEEDRLSFKVFVFDKGSAQLIGDRNTLEAHALQLQQHVSTFVAGHIWQHDSLRFAVVQVQRARGEGGERAKWTG